MAHFLVCSALKKGNVRYKSSEPDKGHNLMASKLESTWRKLHVAPKAKAVSTKPTASTPLPTATLPAPVWAQGMVPVQQYTDYCPGTIPYRIDDDDRGMGTPLRPGSGKNDRQET